MAAARERKTRAFRNEIKPLKDCQRGEKVKWRNKFAPSSSILSHFFFLVLPKGKKITTNFILVAKIFCHGSPRMSWKQMAENNAKEKFQSGCSNASDGEAGVYLTRNSSIFKRVRRRTDNFWLLENHRRWNLKRKKKST